MRIRVIRPETHCLLKMRESFLGLFQVLKDKSQIMVRCRFVRFEPQRYFVLGCCVPVTSFCKVRFGERCASLCIFR